MRSYQSGSYSKKEKMILVLVSFTPSTKEEVIIQRGLSLLDRIGS